MNRTTLRSTATLIFCLLLPVAALAAGSPSVDSAQDAAETLFNEGVELMEGGDFAQAAAQFEQVLEAKEDFAPAHNNLAYSLRKQGAENFDRALKHYNRALELDPELAQAYHYRGVLHALAGDEAAAKADHASLLDLDRDLADELMQVIASGEEPAGTGGAAAWR